MRYYKAPITITGQVFVSENELCESLNTTPDRLHDCHDSRINVALSDIANDKVHALFSSDEPVKMRDFDIEDFS